MVEDAVKLLLELVCEFPLYGGRLTPLPLERGGVGVDICRSEILPSIGALLLVRDEGPLTDGTTPAEVLRLLEVVFVPLSRLLELGTGLLPSNQSKSSPASKLGKRGG